MLQDRFRHGCSGLGKNASGLPAHGIVEDDSGVEKVRNFINETRVNACDPPTVETALEPHADGSLDQTSFTRTEQLVAPRAADASELPYGPWLLSEVPLG